MGHHCLYEMFLTNSKKPLTLRPPTLEVMRYGMMSMME